MFARRQSALGKFGSQFCKSGPLFSIMGVGVLELKSWRKEREREKGGRADDGSVKEMKK